MVGGYNYSLIVCPNVAHPLKTYEALCYIFSCHLIMLSTIIFSPKEYCLFMLHRFCLFLQAKWYLV